MSDQDSPVQGAILWLRRTANDGGKLFSACVGLVWGLWGSRLLAELGGGPWRLRLLLPILAISMALGLTAALLWAHRGQLTWPMLLPGLYLLWPWPEPWVAASLIIASVALAGLIYLKPKLSPCWPELIFGLTFLTLYLATLSPGLLPADSGEFQLVAATLGIAHPPGYALYTMLGKLATLAPLGSPALCLNAMSAVFASATLVVIIRSIRRQGGSLGAAAAPVLMLGLAATFWAQATTANIRSLTALFTALCLATLLRWEEARKGRWLTLFAASFGLGVGHHASLGLLGPPFLAFILLTDKRILLEPRRWLAPLAALFGSLLVIIYLPLRSAMQPAFDPSPIRDWGSFVQHVLALGFGGDMFRYRTWDVLRPRLGVWTQIMRLEFGSALPIISAIAVPLVAKKGWRVAVLLVGAWLMNTLAAVTYRAPQTVEYLMPSYVALAFLLGTGLTEVEQRLPQRRALTSSLAVVVCLVALVVLPQNWRSFRSLHRNSETRDTAYSLLEASPPHALILSSWHQATPLWYLQLVEGLRQDVVVHYVYPEGGTPNDEVWLRRIAEGLEQGPVIVTNRFHAYDNTDYVWLPLSKGWLVQKEPLSRLPDDIERIDVAFEDQVMLLGFQVDDDTLTPGESLQITVYWTPQAPLTQDYATFVQLLGPQGVLGQGDLAHQRQDYQPGQLCVDVYRFPLLTHTTPGSYQLMTGFYYAQDGASYRLQTTLGDYVPLQHVAVTASSSTPVTLHPRHDRWAGGLSLIGVDYDQSLVGQTRLYLHWRQEKQGHHPVEGTTVVLQSEGNPSMIQVELPPLPPGGTSTVALDLAAELAQVDLAVLDQGQPRSRLLPWHRGTPRPLTLALPRGGACYVPLGNAMALVGLGRPAQSRAGEESWFQPQFLALAPLTQDYSVSLGLEGESGWEVKSDGTPALGAIPTLKWVRGWRVVDPRHVGLPKSSAGEEATVTLSVYDAFTLEPLQVLDERRVRQGQGVTLKLDQISIGE